MNNTEDQTDIIFDYVVKKINLLGKESNKADFIHNFNEVKNKILMVDEVLDRKNDIDPNTPIDKLFEMLIKYDEDDEELDVEQFKHIKNIIELIEIKLHSKMEITEIK